MKPEIFRHHSVFEKLEQFKAAISSEPAKTKLGIDNDLYFNDAHGFIKSKLQLCLPLLVHEPELNQLSTEVEAATSLLNTFYGDNNAGHLQNALNNIFSAVNRVKSLPLPTSTGDYDFSKSSAQYQETLARNFEILNTKNIEIQSQFHSLIQELSQKQNQIAELNKLLIEKQAEIQNLIGVYNSDFEALKTTANSTIEVERKKFNETFDADRKTYKDLIEADKESFKKNYEENQKTINTQASEIVTQLNKKLSEARSIVNIVGNVGVTGNYQAIANQHKDAANFFRWIALGFMVVMSCLLIYSIVNLSSGDFDLYKSLVRILAAAVLTYPAVYASRESSKHRNLETQNRNLELELASVGPFIELLPEDKKQEIKKELVNKYFGKNTSFTGENVSDKDDVSVSALEKILKTVLPFVKK